VVSISPIRDYVPILVVDDLMIEWWSEVGVFKRVEPLPIADSLPPDLRVGKGQVK
jgi:hypothetical protein